MGDNLGSTQVLDFSWLTSRGPDVFFQGGESTLGTELWITDGTKAGTHQIKDINPVVTQGSRQKSWSSRWSATNLYFVANDGTHDWQLWRSDGTESGTVPLTGFVTSYDREIRPTGMQALGSKILFFADDGAPGAKLWSLDSRCAGVHGARERQRRNGRHGRDRRDRRDGRLCSGRRLALERWLPAARPQAAAMRVKPAATPTAARARAAVLVTPQQARQPRAAVVVPRTRRGRGGAPTSGGHGRR